MSHQKQGDRNVAGFLPRRGVIAATMTAVHAAA